MTAVRRIALILLIMITMIVDDDNNNFHSYPKYNNQATRENQEMRLGSRRWPDKWRRRRGGGRWRPPGDTGLRGRGPEGGGLEGSGPEVGPASGNQITRVS